MYQNKPMMLADGYKFGHPEQYPPDTEYVLMNWTPRGTRIPGQMTAVKMGSQYYKYRYLMDEMNELFFARPRGEVVDEFRRGMDKYLGVGSVNAQRISDLHDLQYLPLRWRELPEGTFCPLRVPMLTIENTHPAFFWLPNHFESHLSDTIWLPITSATTALRYRRLLDGAARTSGGPAEFVNYQAHDFSMRGMQSLEAAITSGMGHLLFFEGTDTYPTIDAIEYFYPVPEGYVIGVSIPATEHSVMCAGGFADEPETLRQDVYPTGPFSAVSDTWDLWHVLTKTLIEMRDLIMEVDGKLVVRPDSGDPVLIICGDPDATPGSPAFKGVIELLWDGFGGTVNTAGFRELDSHIGAIYGDSITEQRAEQIVTRLMAKGFASTNIVLGIGSFTYSFTTRDVYGQAGKVTHVTRGGVGMDVWKDPVTDDGTKKSAKGRLAVARNDDGLYLIEGATPEEEAASLLIPTWENGEFLPGRFEGFDVIRARAHAQLAAAVA